jgi:hypothetical protein
VRLALLRKISADPEGWSSEIGNAPSASRWNNTSGAAFPVLKRRGPMNNIIWLVGAVVIVLAILSFFGFR